MDAHRLSRLLSWLYSDLRWWTLMARKIQLATVKFSILVTAGSSSTLPWNIHSRRTCSWSTKILRSIFSWYAGITKIHENIVSRKFGAIWYQSSYWKLIWESNFLLPEYFISFNPLHHLVCSACAINWNTLVTYNYIQYWIHIFIIHLQSTYYTKSIIPYNKL